MNIDPSTPAIPWLNTVQMIEVDRLMIEKYHIILLQMMENAGRNLAHLSKHRFLNSQVADKKIVVMAGVGGNGGGALVAARRLHNYGADVRVITTKDDAAFKDVPAHQLKSLREIGIPVNTISSVQIEQITNHDLVLDGVIGYSLRGAPRGGAKDLIDWTSQQTAPILSLDMPSGVDGTTGTVFNPAIKADATLTLALPKEGLRTNEAAPLVGELYVGDISVPPELYTEKTLNIKVGPIFEKSDIIQIV